MLHSKIRKLLHRNLLERQNLVRIQTELDAALSGCIILAGDSHAAYTLHPEFPRPTLNLGIAGATARSYARSLDSLHTPVPGSLSILIIGTNDIRRRSPLSKPALTNFSRHAERVIDRLRSWTLDVLVAALPPRPKSDLAEQAPLASEVYSDALREICARRGADFFDPFAPLRSSRFGLAEDAVFIDGTHLYEYDSLSLRISNHIRSHYRLEEFFCNHLPGFDHDYYRGWYPDACHYPRGLARHYLDLGWKEGRDPSGQFSTDGYLDANPDVRVSGINPLIHFLEIGLTQGRTGWQKAHTNPTSHSLTDWQNLPDNSQQ
ncbi:GDSL-type esterase/lipase family protein [Methylobacterium sp. WL7]|uniref:SGNH/GDSL hydrolase family protein n=1 Tax=Methylobacterium sp. WL7 TaxID=2603900 RepID=UPI0011CAB805|nr:GDSL-type esterase/lipase family protein [Methylobacterium sp. WL7]TXN42535.1 hypothetical protein FV233_22335 [Methylobacterium sp. WL7]